MMALDSYNNLDTFPLEGWNEFITACLEHKVQTVYFTGTNTDPMLYKRPLFPVKDLHDRGFKVGIRTNGVHVNRAFMNMLDTGSLTVCSMDEKHNTRIMGGPPPDVKQFLSYVKAARWTGFKVNIVLDPTTVQCGDLLWTIRQLADLGVQRINLREPYGQPHIGNPLNFDTYRTSRLGMPVHRVNGAEVCYWDVHYVEVESVNLYANGKVSTDYPITRGHHHSGFVLDQSHFRGGRQRKQWLLTPKA